MPVAALVLAGTAAPPAGAAEVSTTERCVWTAKTGCRFVPEARFVAGAGEANRLSIAWDEHDGVFVFRDSAPIGAGAGCAAAADGAVACRAHDATVDLGDGDDRAVAADSAGRFLDTIYGALAVDGGPGDDELTGGGTLYGGAGQDRLAGSVLLGDDGDDVLVGTAKDDFLFGGTGTDTIEGGDGRDLVSGDASRYRPAGPAPDILSGGSGGDTLDYGDHTVSVTVDLGATFAGPGDAPDRIQGFEGVRGGAGDDVLAGDGRANQLGGGQGRDTIRGGPGDDRVGGGGGEDVLSGGPGDDWLAGYGGRDRYSGGAGSDELFLDGTRRTDEIIGCGPGRDEVLFPSLALLGRDCELADELPVHPSADRAGRLGFAIPAAARRGRGRLELRVRGRDRPFAVGRFRAGATVRVRLPVPARIRRLRREPLAVVVRVVSARRSTVRWVIDLPR